ncbi:hypothetical protein H9P43_003500 [Blastocladiella emersonii ATCC 22665]|nr:hypothetical protein H9P43_003500 [Blastocladiella emersonii ATCC 22665]
MGARTSLAQLPGPSRDSGSSRSRPNLEDWSRINLSSATRRTTSVEDLGMIGYAGRTGWFINRKVTDRLPGLVLESWKPFTKPEVLALLPPAGTTQPAKTQDGSWLCDSKTYPYCRDGTFVPPQCQGDLMSDCKEFWHTSPEDNRGVNEQRIVSLGLKLVVVYLGDRHSTAVSECVGQDRSACLFHNTQPALQPSASDLLCVRLPAYSPDCTAQFDPAKVGVAGNKLECDWDDTQQPLKTAPAGFDRENPNTATFLRAVSLRDSEIMGLMLNASASSVRQATCAWIRGNEARWSKWIPPPPPDYVKTLDQADLADPYGILFVAFGAPIVAAAAILIALVAWHRHHFVIKAASPAFLVLSATGAGLHAFAILPEIMFPDSGVCTARVYTLALGICTILASCTVKSLPIILAAGSRPFTPTTMRARDFCVRAGAVIATDAALIALWTYTNEPVAIRSDLSLWTVGFACGPAVYTPAAVATTALLSAFHGVLILVAIVVAVKGHGIPTATNESRALAVAVSRMAGACFIVVPLPLPYNFELRIPLVFKIFGIVFGTGSVLVEVVARPVLAAMYAAAPLPTPASQQILPGGLDAKAAIASAGSATILARQMAVPEFGSGTETLSGSVASGKTGSGSVSTADPMIRTGTGLALRQMGSLFRRWRTVNVALLFNPTPSLQFTFPAEKSSTGLVYTRVRAAARVYPRSAHLAVPSPACLLINLDGVTLMVRATSAAEADEWVAAIRSAFGLEGSGGAKSRAGSPSSTLHHPEAAWPSAISTHPASAPVPTAGRLMSLSLGRYRTSPVPDGEAESAVPAAVVTTAAAAGTATLDEHLC